MIEKYLSAFLHPNRVSLLVEVIETLSSLGLDDCGQTVETLIQSGSDHGDDGVLAAIASTVEVSLVAALTQFGVTVEYTEENALAQLDLLVFLANWGSPDGLGPESVALDEDSIYELGGNSVDILVEFYSLCSDDTALDIDWVLAVDRFLIDRLHETLTTAYQAEQEPVSIADSVLTPLKGFSSKYPNNPAVQYVRDGGRIGLPINQVVAVMEEHIKSNLPLGETAELMLGIGLISDTPRENLKDTLGAIIESAFGASGHTAQLLARFNGLYKDVFGNHG